jgi:hypothetical protein
MNQIYLDTARLLTQVAPLVFADGVLDLKGGTAINLFVRDMPRLSVDLDLVFPRLQAARDKALVRINEGVRETADRLKSRPLGSQERARPQHPGQEPPSAMYFFNMPLEIVD